jgi:hypothetical protein
MLRNQLHRGSKVHPPKSERIFIDGYYNPIPLKHQEHKIRGTESNLMFQLRRGAQVPDPQGRLIDHDRSDRINTQNHGIKVQLNKSTVDSLKKTDLLNKLEELKSILIKATPEEIKSLESLGVASTILAPTRVGLQSGIRPPDPLSKAEMKEVKNAQYNEPGDPKRLKNKTLNVLANRLGVNTVLPRNDKLKIIFSKNYVDLQETQNVLQGLKNGTLDSDSNEQDITEAINGLLTSAVQ